MWRAIPPGFYVVVVMLVVYGFGLAYAFHNTHRRKKKKPELPKEPFDFWGGTTSDENSTE